MRFWPKIFANGNFSLENQEKGQPKSPMMILKLEVVENDSKTSVREIVVNFSVALGIL